MRSANGRLRAGSGADLPLSAWKVCQQIERYAEQYHRIKKAMDEVQEVQEDLQRQQHEMAELQRLAENRQDRSSKNGRRRRDGAGKRDLGVGTTLNDYDKGLSELAVGSVIPQRSQDYERRIQLLLEMAERRYDGRSPLAIGRCALKRE
jgi:hypothetical protein